MKKLCALLLMAALCLCAALALAEYPERPITMIVPYAAGGTTDVYGRTVAALLEEQLGQSITVVNQGGASGSIGCQYVYDQAADGYTLLVTAETMGTYKTMGVCDLGYDDFTIISPLVGDPKIIVVGKDSPYNTLEELLDAIKANRSSSARTPRTASSSSTPPTRRLRASTTTGSPSSAGCSMTPTSPRSARRPTASSARKRAV